MDPDSTPPLYVPTYCGKTVAGKSVIIGFKNHDFQTIVMKQISKIVQDVLLLDKFESNRKIFPQTNWKSGVFWYEIFLCFNFCCLTIVFDFLCFLFDS